jgi:sugar/nucleoside kinase (ribokinase family)
MRRDVLCIGTAVYDLLLSNVPDDMMRKDSSMATKLTVASGGDALNASINLASLGFDVALCACVGKDDFADAIMGRVEAMGVDTQYVRRTDAAQTSVSILLLDKQGEMFGNNVKGGADLLNKNDVTDAMMQEFSHLHLCSLYDVRQLVGKDLRDLFKRAKAHGMTTSMDTEKVKPWQNGVEDMVAALPYCDIFMPSYGEIVAVTGIEDLQELKAYFQPYGLTYFGVKMGAKGLFVTDFEQDLIMPPFATGKVVDTTGAGDATMASFVGGFLRGYTMQQCAALAMAQASLIVTTIGANLGVRDFETVRQIAKDKGYDLPPV